MPKYWMISNRKVQTDGFGEDKGDLTYWEADAGPLDVFTNWRMVPSDQFQKDLVAACQQFPDLPPASNEEQSHVTFFVHGYNNGWKFAAQRYQKICDTLYQPDGGLGICIGFDWPSLGNMLGYLPDREHARLCANDLASVLSALYEWLVGIQTLTQRDPANACKAKVSMISHSMGNYVLQKAMAAAWTRKNQPLLVSLINQLVMVAADVDNDLFQPTAQDANDGNAIANLTYRITALYSGRDAVLGMSAGLKHFGTRRLGRSGLAQVPPPDKDNVWHIDCSNFFPASDNSLDIHSAYFDVDSTLYLIRDILKGIDRKVMETRGMLTATAAP